MDHFSCSEASILHTGQDTVDAVLRLRNGTIISRESRIRSTGQELDSGGTGAVGDANGTRKLDEIASSDIVCLKKRGKSVDRVINTVVGGEVGLNFAEDNHGAIGSCSLERTSCRKADSIMEGKTERFVNVFTALAVKDGLKIIAESKEWTTLGNRAISELVPISPAYITYSFVTCSIDAIRARNTFNVSGASKSCEGDSCSSEPEDHCESDRAKVIEKDSRSEEAERIAASFYTLKVDTKISTRQTIDGHAVAVWRRIRPAYAILPTVRPSFAAALASQKGASKHSRLSSESVAAIFVSSFATERPMVLNAVSDCHRNRSSFLTVGHLNNGCKR